MKTLKIADLRKSIADKAMEKFAERFWSQVKKSEHGCWEWQGKPRGKDGMYGQIHPPGMGRQIAPHRAAWLLHFGEIPVHDRGPNALVVRHTCDNPRCVKIDHLILGTQLDNVRDMISRGRARYASGENARSKLNWKKVEEIRAKHAAGMGQRALSREYGVSYPAIHNVVHFQTWRPEQKPECLRNDRIN